MLNGASTTVVMADKSNAHALHNPTLWDQMESYRHEGVCRRFAEEYGKSIEDAERIFLEMKRFIYTAIVSQQPCSPSKIIDAMWPDEFRHQQPQPNP
jgi:hypothetical protein